MDIDCEFGVKLSLVPEYFEKHKFKPLGLSLNRYFNVHSRYAEMKQPLRSSFLPVTIQ